MKDILVHIVPISFSDMKKRQTVDKSINDERPSDTVFQPKEGKIQT